MLLLSKGCRRPGSRWGRLEWIATHAKLKKSDVLLRRLPAEVYASCAGEGGKWHIYLHCSVALNLWWILFQKAKERQIHRTVPLLCEGYKDYGSGQQAKVLWACSVLAVIRVT